MTKICVKVKTKEYFIKKAKPLSNASQVYLNKRFIDIDLNLIPIYDCDNIIINEINDFHEINIESNVVFRKKAKKRGRGAYCYLPLEYSGFNFLIFEAPY